MWDEYMASDEEVDISYNKEDFFSINERKLRKKYQFKNITQFLWSDIQKTKVKTTKTLEIRVKIT